MMVLGRFLSRRNKYVVKYRIVNIMEWSHHRLTSNILDTLVSKRHYFDQPFKHH